MAIYTQTVEQIKRDIARWMGGLLFAGTFDSGSTTTGVDALLKPWDDDDNLNGKIVEFFSGNAAGDVREITDYTASSGTITFETATGAVSTDRYHIYDPAIVRPELLDELIAEAVASLARYRFLQITNQELILDDLLRGDGGMERWTASTTPDNWTVGGTGGTGSEQTRANDKRLVRQGNSSAKLVSDGTNACYFEYEVPHFYRYRGVLLTGKAWVMASTATRVDVLVGDVETGGTTVNSDDHTSFSTWEELTTVATKFTTIGNIGMRLRIAAGIAITAYFDHVRLISAERISDYSLPSTLRAISRIFVEGTKEDNFDLIEIPTHLYRIDRSASELIIDRNRLGLYSDRRLHIVGLGSMTIPTGNSSTVEVPEYVKAYVRYELTAQQPNTGEIRLQLLKTKVDEEFARARRLPIARDLQWIER